MKDMEEAMMVVDYSQGDEKLTLNDNNRESVKSPLRGMDCPKMEPSEECKQELATTDSEKSADKGLSGFYPNSVAVF